MSKNRLRAVVASMLMLAGPGVARADNNSTEPPQYTVNFTASAPVIDGKIGPDEWADASPAAGGFVDLRTDVPETNNTRFRMLWDDEFLYFVGETNFGGFKSPPTDYLGNPNFSGLTWTPSLYLDPNANGEDLDAVDNNGNPVPADGYQIAWSMDAGYAERKPVDPLNPFDQARDGDYIMGLYLEAHFNADFGNQGLWSLDDSGPSGNYRDDDHPGIIIAQTGGTNGGVYEVAIAWTEFNATDPAVDPKFTTEFPLYHPFAPSDGEVWAFETSAITPDPDNFLPSWSEPQGGNPNRTAAAVWPHGRITFSNPGGGGLDCNGDGKVTIADADCACGPDLDTLLAQLGTIRGDVDGDKQVQFTDFVAMAFNFGKAGAKYTQGDFNCDGTVQFGDFVILAFNFGKSPPAAATTTAATATATVPEPSGLVLALIGLSALAFRRGGTVARAI